MQTVTVEELKRNFTEVLKRILAGEEIVVCYGKNRQKVAVLVPYPVQSVKLERSLGLLKGRAEVILHADFSITEKEMLAL
jgi:antitoxin (DNA-binding transcriptional repressor) of toxin-antitoxin stability system